MRVRLLRVAVQPTFVLDDDESLTEFTGPVATVPAAQWADFATNSFSPSDLEAMAVKFQEEESP